MANKGSRKSKEEVDKQVAKVDELHTKKGYSINAACKEVGLQNTVYYWRKRKEALQEPVTHGGPQRSSIAVKRTAKPDYGSLDELKREYAKTKEHLDLLKERIIQAAISDLE